MDEIQKFAEDDQEFGTWLNAAERSQDKQKKNVGRDLATLKQQLKEQREFSEDVMGHGADLRFINVTGQKFLDASKVRISSSSSAFCK